MINYLWAQIHIEPQLNKNSWKEKEMAIHSSILAWKIPWTEEPGRLVHGVAKSQTRLNNFTFTFKTLNPPAPRPPTPS